MIKDLIENGIKSLTENLSNILATITATGEELIENGINFIKTKTNECLNEIRKIEEEAVNKLVDTSECIGDNIDTIKDLPATSIVDLNKCLSDNLEQAQYIIYDAVEQIEKLLGDVDEIKSNLSKCERNLICLLSVSTSSGKLVITITGSITAVSVKAVQTLISVGKDVSLCIADTLTRITLTAVEITDTTMKCIRTKIDSAEFQKLI